MLYKEINSCRACNSKDLIPVLSLGEQYIVNFLDQTEEPKLYKAPLDLVLCNDCKLLQLKHTVNRDLLFRKYWYKSGVNKTMKNILKSITKECVSIVSPSINDIVVDIGCNDGTMLRYYPKHLIRVGFEPATNLVREARKGTSVIINDYFTSTKYNEIFKKKAKIITAIAMFYDLEDPNSFVAEVKEILDEEGIFVIQMNYLALMILNNAFDNIGHEHLEYYSLYALERLLEKHGLEVFKVELNDVNGGSFKIFIKHLGCQKYPIDPSVERIRKWEKDLKLEDPETYTNWFATLEKLKEETRDFVFSQIRDGKKIYLYGASTRGSTLLQYYGLGKETFQKAAEKNPAKWNKLYLPFQIPIIPEDKARAEMPDYFFILPWQFSNEFIVKEQEYLKKGGKIIIPLPKFRIVSC